MSAVRLNTNNFLNPPFNGTVRRDELLAKVREIENRLGLAQRVKLELSPFHETPCAVVAGNAIRLPTWFLFRYEDIPQRLRISDMEDPRLGDDHFLNELAEWMNTQFREAGLSSTVRPADHGILQLVIKFMRDRNLYEKSKDFTISHELAHLNHAQADLKTLNLHSMNEATSAAGIIGGILLLVLAVATMPFVPLTVTLIVGGVAIMVSVGSIYAFDKMKFPFARTALEEEKLADLDAARALQDATGGIYLFETYRNQNQGVRRSDPSKMATIDAYGNNLSDRKHPPLTERIAYLEEWQAQNSMA